MVRGLDVFRRHFAGATDRFLLIGGVAAHLWFEDAGLRARATKDLDIVFRAEGVDPAFVMLVWDFVRAGRYETKQRSDGRREFFRFLRPQDEAYPWMLEIFAAAPDRFQVPDDQKIVPVPADDDVSSLSAILVDEDYYQLIAANARQLTGLQVVTPACLILLKARAWPDLSSRRAAGETVDSKSIRKHRDDVFRLSLLLVEGEALEVGERVHDDFGAFLDRFPPGSNEWDGVRQSAKSLGLDPPPPVEVVELLREHFVRRPARSQRSAGQRHAGHAAMEHTPRRRGGRGSGKRVRPREATHPASPRQAPDSGPDTPRQTTRARNHRVPCSPQTEASQTGPPRGAQGRVPAPADRVSVPTRTAHAVARRGLRQSRPAWSRGVRRASSRTCAPIWLSTIADMARMSAIVDNAGNVSAR